MVSILENILSTIFVFFGVSLILTILNYAFSIRPVALRNRKSKSVLSRFFWFSGAELSDYWEVEKIAKAENDAGLLGRLKIFRYCMYSTVLFFVLGFIFFLTTLIVSLANNN
jgi:hypothetical protein